MTTLISYNLLAVRLFMEPLKLWDYWPWLLLPLCFAVSVVYKSVRSDTMRPVAGEAVKMTIWVVAGMSAAAAGLWVLVWATSR